MLQKGDPAKWAGRGPPQRLREQRGQDGRDPSVAQEEPITEVLPSQGEIPEVGTDCSFCGNVYYLGLVRGLRTILV